MVQITADTTKMNYITGDISYIKKEKRIQVTLNWCGNMTEPEVSSVGSIQAIYLAKTTVPSVAREQAAR